MPIDEIEPSEKEDHEGQKNNKYSTSQWITIIALASGNLCIGGNISLQAPFFPQEAEDKGATPTEYGLIFGTYQLAIFIAAPLMGKLVAYVEPKFLLNIGILINGLTCLMFGFLDYVNETRTFVCSAFIIRAVEGIGAAAVKTSAYAIIAEQFPHSMSTVMASLETFLGLGLIIGPTVGGALYDLSGFGLPFYVVGSLLLIDTVVIFLFMPKPGWTRDNGKGQMLKYWLHPSTFVYAAAIFTAFNYIGFNQSTLEPHLREFHLSGTYLGMFFAISGVFYAASSPCWGWLCDKKCNVHLISGAGYLLMICSLLLIGPMPLLNLENGLITTVVALVLMGCGISAKLVSSFSGSLQDTGLRGFPHDMKTYALTSSMIASSQSLGAFVGPSLGGYLLESKGYDPAVTVVLLMDLVFFILLVFYATVVKRFLFGEKNTVEKNHLLETRPLNGKSTLVS